LDEFVLQLLAECVEKHHDRLSKQVQGRKPTYDPMYHIPLVLNAMANGACFDELALETGVMPATIECWMHRYPEFKECIALGRTLAKAWWIRKGRLNIHNTQFNSTLFMMTMSNLYGWSRSVNGKSEVTHTERREVALSINDGGTSKGRMSELSVEKLAEIGAILDRVDEPAPSEKQDVIDA
jgi:hypothetical protein